MIEILPNSIEHAKINLPHLTPQVILPYSKGLLPPNLTLSITVGATPLDIQKRLLFMYVCLSLDPVMILSGTHFTNLQNGQLKVIKIC